MTCEQATEQHGYIMHMDWLERMAKRYTQHQCPKCKLWHVWKRQDKVSDLASNNPNTTTEPLKSAPKSTNDKEETQDAYKIISLVR